jgi:two-component system, NtrC family, response regulator AtoC
LRAHVLVIDDETLIRQSLKGVLAQEGFEVTTAGSLAEGWERFQQDRPDAVLLDLVLGDGDGLDLLKKIKHEAPDTKVILISAHGSIESAVAAMKLGGYDFIKKPFELEEIVAAVRNAVRTSALEGRVAYLVAQQRQRVSGASPESRSARMRQVLDEVRLVARNPVPVVLVLGESGAGKQVIARMLHDLSTRADGPFVELNCSAIPENLVESELFGHERGAFSDARERKLGLVEIADGGTLFLDEIGDLGAAAQAKLLTFIEQRTFRRVGSTSARKVDVRIVAATNRDPAALVAEKRFREDLFFRLNSMIIRLPALRDRREDVAPLAEHFLSEASKEFRRRWRSLARETGALLERYRWPGNVRELRAVIARAALLHDDEVLRPEHLPAELVAAALEAETLQSGRATEVGSGRPIPTLDEMELSYIRRVLDLCGGNRTVAAQHLGITRQTLAKKVGGTPEE